MGLFAVDYETAAGPKRALYTQFEVAEARRFVPSWDEPGAKATFTMRATIPTGQLAVSNMPVATSTDLGGGRTRVEFQSSPKMSTYLLFFSVGEFERLSGRVGDTEVGVVTQKGISSQGAYALESSQAVLKEYNSYFGAAYPLPKLDNIASPGSSMFFSAMENWGAIYTFEYSILLDPSISSQADRQNAFETAAHEIAHQWFGDLVTMQWWDDLWLNEGFASWLGGRTTERLHPEWSTRLTAVNSRETAMSRDALATTHPVVQRVETVEQANQAFDAISYLKGEAVLRMLEDYVGSDAWRDGVRRYINTHRYGNTVSQDFWQAIETSSGRPISAIAHDFTLQPGVPMILADATCTAGRTTLRLTQTEFSRDKPDKKPLSWRVPVTIKSIDGSQNVHKLVTGGSASAEVPGCSPLVVNAGQSGYYRTLYSRGMFNAIAGDFAATAPIDQLGILSDSWALGRSGRQPVTDFLQLVAKVSSQADAQIWRSIAGVLQEIDRLYAGDAARQKQFRRFALAQLTPVFSSIGWMARPGELEITALLRSDLIDALSTFGDPGVIEEARRRYAARNADAAAMPATLRKSILGVVATNADAAIWEEIHEAARAEKTPLVREDLYALLARTSDDALAHRALELALTDEPGASNSANMIYTTSTLHPDLAFDFSQANFAVIYGKIDPSSRTAYFALLARGSTDPAMIAKVRAYAEARLPADLRRDADTTIARINDRIAIRKNRPARDRRLAGNDTWYVESITRIPCSAPISGRGRCFGIPEFLVALLAGLIDGAACFREGVHVTRIDGLDRGQRGTLEHQRIGQPRGPLCRNQCLALCWRKIAGAGWVDVFLIRVRHFTTFDGQQVCRLRQDHCLAAQFGPFRIGVGLLFNRPFWPGSCAHRIPQQLRCRCQLAGHQVENAGHWLWALQLHSGWGSG